MGKKDEKNKNVNNAKKSENLESLREEENYTLKNRKKDKNSDRFTGIASLISKFQNKNVGSKNRIVTSAVAIVVIIAIIAIIALLVVNNIRKANMLKSNPELARAMTYDEVKDGENIVEGTDGNVKFDAFFLRDLNGDGYAESIRGTSKEIGQEDTLYMELNVDTAGYLKDAKITINDGNFYFQTALPKDDELKDNYVGSNVREIEFNDLNNGTQKLLTGIVRSGDYSYSSRENAAIGNNINNYSKVDSVTLTGTYVNESNQEVQITKTVNFNIDWYGTTRAQITNTYLDYDDIENRLDEENGKITLDFSIRTSETDNELILKSNHVEAQIPQLNGYDPLEVVYTGSNATSNYDAETKTLTIDREAVVGEDGIVTTGLSRSNSYSVRVTYPIEAYQSLGEETVTIKIPVITYYEGYNNPNEEFTNPYKSNTATATIVASYRKMQGESARFDITVGKYISYPSYRYIVSKQKPLRIYNGVSAEETEDTYQVRWDAYTGTDGASTGLVMKETENDKAQVVDNFIKTDSNKESMENVTTNIGIAFSGADSILKEDGWIKVYDEETGDLLVTFTKSDWNKYTASNPYKYELPVKHIRIETSETNANSYLTVYNIKELDDEYITTNYTREAFDNLQYIQSNLVGYLGGNYVNTDTHQAHYEAPYSIADIGISNNTISTQTTERNEKLTITARYNEANNQVGWVDGSFIVKLPEEIIDAQINNVQINNNNVSITSYELIDQDGIKLIKINTKNDDTTPQTYSITVDVDITPDPRVATISRNIELYASNEEVSDYYYSAEDIYDVNDNLNTTEQVNHDTISLSMVSPNSLLTNQVGSNYDDKGSQVISPQVADVRPSYAVVENEEREVTIGVQMRNNYGSTISEIQILGKIPFEGNTYVLSGGDLASEFTTKMKDTGIEVPAELQQYVTVYYSENEKPNRDLSKAENGWKTADQVTNWDNVKTFLIDLGDYVMPTGAEYVFNYTVKIPNGVEFNKVAYSHHGIYFSLDTDQGKYRTQVEPNKLGFRIAEKYNLELTKYQTGKDKVIPGATYSFTDEETGESKTAVTNEQGVLTINNLYAEKAYTIQEIKTPNNYELNSDVIRFIGHVDENGTLTIEKTSGTTKEDMQVIKNEGEDYKVTVKVEDEVKASIKIHKTEQGTSNVLQNVKYKLTGYNLPEDGKVLTTDENGEVTVTGLTINQYYTLEEIKAEGYYLASQVRFRIRNNSGNYSIQTSSGTIASQSTTEEDSIPTITMNIEDEKIPRYSLEILKIKKTIDTEVSNDATTSQDTTNSANSEVTPLRGAKFKLYKGTEVIGEYTTNTNGTVTINDLYQYIEGRDEEAVYTLKEVLAPEGYAKVKDITFKVDGTNGSLEFINTEGTSENYTVDGNTVKLTIEDSPSFRLIKKDAETGELLANVKFAIYNIDEGEVPATNSKGEILGTKETINGREYYTLTTNTQGEIIADLTEGFYKAIELEAPEKYDTSEVYYFGIGASREGNSKPTEMKLTFADSFGGRNSYYDDAEIKTTTTTSDGAIVVGGNFGGTIQIGDETLTCTETASDQADDNNDGLIIKYRTTGKVEWIKQIGGNLEDKITSVTGTSDGGIIAGGYFASDSIQVGDYVLTNNSTVISYHAYDGLIIKYSSTGEVEWATSIGGSDRDYINSVAEATDGGYIAGGYFASDSIQVGNETLTNTNTTTYPYTFDGLIIKYSSTGEVDWAKNIGGSSSDYIYSVAETSDGGILAGGYFYSDSIQVGNEELTSNGNNDGLIIKYNREGEVEWADSFGGNSLDYIESAVETSDGGYIAGGYFSSSTIQVGDYVLTNNSTVSYRPYDGLIIKYSSEGEVEWAKNIGGSGDDEITSVASTSDGGYIVGGYFYSDSIQVGNEELTSNGNNDGLIIKYNREGEVEWADSFGGNSLDYINSVAETNDGVYIAGGYFYSDSIQVGNKRLTNNGYSSAMILKYEEINIPSVTNAELIGDSEDDHMNSVTTTSDGGYIVGGDFTGTIQVGSETLTSNGYSDGLIIKYNLENEIEWIQSFGGTGTDHVSSIASTSDGGYIVGGSFSGTIQIGNETFRDIYGTGSGLIIKYSNSGEVEWAKSFGGSYQDSINSVATTSDGGYIVGGYFSSTIQVGNETLTNNGSYGSDGLIIKYSSSGDVEWAKNIGGSSDDSIRSVAEASDGGYIVGGYFYSDSIQVGDVTITNSNSGWPDGLIIKYSNSGEVEWAKSFGGSSYDQITSVASTSDGGAIAGGYFNIDSIQVGNETLTNNGGYDGLIIKYSSTGEVEWAKNIGGSSSDYINSVAITNDGDYIVGGHFNGNLEIENEELAATEADGFLIKLFGDGEIEWIRQIKGGKDEEVNSVVQLDNGEYVVSGYSSSSTIQAGDKILTNKGGTDGFIIKYGKQEIELPNPVVTNVKSVGNNYYSSAEITSVVSTSDGGYITGGYFGDTIQVENETLRSNGTIDGLIVKYNAGREVEWAKNIGGSWDDQINSVAETSDGGYIIGGYFQSSTIEAGNITLTNNGSTSYSDGLIIKYSSSGEIEWAKSFGGDRNDRVTSVAQTNDGGYIAGGYFQSSTITVGNKVITNNSTSTSYSDAIIIKYNAFGEIEWAESFGGSISDSVNSVASTSDGGFLAGGDFQSTIQVENETLTSNGSTDCLIIKYSSTGKVEWAKNIGGSSSDYINSVAATEDGGYIAGGDFYSKTIQVGNETLTSNGSGDGLIIKYSSSGEVEWAKNIGGSHDDYIYSVAETSDGGVIAGGLLNGMVRIQAGKQELKGNGENDALIIKYNEEGEVEWAKSFGGSSDDEILSVTETNDGKVVAGGYFESDTIEVDGHTLENQASSDGMILEVVNQVGVPEVQELVIENNLKQFKITTDVNEVDGIKGGSISGEDMDPYETVKYGDNSIQKIVMTPDENYEIIGITVNGEEWQFKESEDGIYTMPQFTNMTEDKHVVVTYALKDNKITINKVDSEDNNTKIAGATFKLDQLDERTNPDNEEIMGDIVANGTEYIGVNKEKGEVTGVLGDLTNNGTYYFVQNEDGTLTPTNSKTYQTANGGSAGIQNVTANSYIPINLSNKSGQYVVVVNASVSSESADYGYATINQTTTAPTYSNSTGRFMYISGTSSSVTTAKDYTSSVLQGGQTYYLHLGYRKDSSIDTGNDQVVINSIKVYEASSTSYNFVDNSKDGYESNNQGQNSTTANSYIPIDLTNYTGKYDLTVNAEIASENNDYGYATVTSSTSAPSYSTNNSSSVRFIYISGEQKAQDYTTVLQGGQMYYLHFGYYKNSSTSSGDDKFTINSVKLSLNGSELYHTEVTTNSEGQAITQIPFGRYQITEIVAPEGYVLNTEPTIVEFRADGNHEFTIENDKAAKVIVHHYLKDSNGAYTTTPVADDETLEGKVGDAYTTSPKLDLEQYELEKDTNGNYVIPSNATGKYTSQTIEVTYYYEVKEVPLIVHHYIDGTTTPVPLKSGEVAQDVTDSGKEGEEYTTNAIEDSLLSDNYELVETPSNATGKYTAPEVVVTYYYKKVSRQVVINKYDEDGKTPLAGVKFNIALKTSPNNIIGTYTTDSKGQITNNLESGEYIATEVEVPEGYDLPENPTAEFSVTKANDVVTVNITNTKTKGTVITHYYIEGTTDKVPLEGGGVAEDVVQTGNVGDIYATKEADNVSSVCELIGTPDNASGAITEGTTEVIYYYRLKDTSVLVHHYIDGTETQVPSKDGGVVEDELIQGKATDPYNTSPSSNVAQNYEVVAEKMPANANGTMTIDQIVVTYYYKLKDPTIEQSKIDKNSTLAKVTEKDQAVPYTITYSANVDIYIGDAEVTIVDYLPYEIVEESSSLDGGSYDANSKTITWTESITGINTFTNTNNQINITKNISLVYKDLDVTQQNVSNRVTGTINLKTPEKTDTVEDTKDIPTEFLVNVPVTKVWDDNNNSAGKRPTEVTMVLTSSDANDTNSPYKHTLTNTENVDAQDSNKWTYTFADLPKYDANGNEIVYTLSEELSNIYYTAENSNVEQDMKTITNTFKVPTDTIDVPVVKVWADNGNVANKRPASVDFVLNGNDGSGLYRHTLTIDNVDSQDSNKWAYTFPNLPKYNSLNGDEITYTLSEENVNSNFYVASVDQGSKTVTNTFSVPDDKTQVTAKKYWDDNSNANNRRPTSAVLTLTGKGQGVDISKEQEVTISNAVQGDDNTWEYTFADLPKYDDYGNEVVYTINEKDLNNDFYIKSNVDQDTRTVTNTFQVPGDKIDVTVTKVWDDNGNSANKRPTSVTLQVKNGDSVVASEAVTEADSVDGDTNKWSHTFSVPKYDAQGQEINYTADELETGSIFYTVENKVIEGNMTSGFTITNKFVVPDERISVPVTKVWDDNENLAGKRPSSVTLVLKGNGQTYKQELTSEINADSSNSNNWRYTFDNLPKYDANGDEINYVLSEELDNIYYTSVNSKVDQNSKTITNKFVVPNDTISVPVVKVWNDNGNAAGKRPDNVTLVLTGNDQNDGRNPYKHTLTAEENVDNADSNRWVYTFTGLPKYNSVNGDEIVYTLSEEDMDSKFYTSSVDDSSKTVTNTFGVPDEKTSVTVTKIWDDRDNMANKRPGSVTMILTGTGEGVNSSYEQVLTAEANADPSNANNWVYTFNDLPKLDNYGNEIKYTVDEEDLGNKFYSKGTVDQDAMTVTNVSEYGKVIVHHYIMESDGTTTTTRVPSTDGTEIPDQTIEGAQGEEYTTNPEENIQANYELVTEKLPANASGTITENDTEVIYYYRLKTPTVTNNVTKSGTDRITSANQEVSYTVTYTANVTDYMGDAEVTIVDTLPYAIDEARSNLDGGTYNSTSKTITWTENVSDLDSYNGKGSVNITKNIKVVYTGLDMNQEKITNNVKGHIKLLTPEKTSDETTNSFDTTIYKAIISAEKLVDKQEAAEGEKVTYTVRITNSGNLGATVTLRDTLPEGMSFDSNTQIMVGDLGTVYTEQNLKNGIQVEVPEFGSVDVTFAGIVDSLPDGEYTKELKNTATIDNEPTNEVTTTVTKANITAHKESDPVSGSKVREGDTITYRIRVRNDGTRAGTVLVKDTVPTGTTFVEGSIKVGDVADSNKTATDLQNGINVTLGIGEEKVVEFKVTVNQIIDGTTIKNTAYINDGEQDKKVPEEPEHTYVEPKDEQDISKTGTSTIDSLDEEISYNINYTAQISDYEGNAKVVLVDQLPYTIDEGKSELDGGTYDADRKTITWEQEVNDIQMTTTKEVQISKAIKVVYTGISQDTVSIENVVKGHIEYETPERTSEEVTANWTTTTGFVINIPVSKVWDDSDNKLGQRPTRVIFKLSGSDGSVRTLEVAKPGTANTTTTQDSNNPNKWNDIFKDLPKYDSSNNEIVYTLTEEEKTEGDLKYYDTSIGNESKTVTNTNKYGKVTVHHYIMKPDGTTTTDKVPDADGSEVPDEVIEGKEGDPYTTEPADNINEKYELVEEKLPENADGTIEKYDEEKPQEVIYYYRLKPAKVIIHYLEKDDDSDDSNNLVLATNEQIDGHVDDAYNTNDEHKKDTISYNGKTYTLVSDSGNTTGTMTVEDTNVTYYYLQNTKATVRYVARDPVTHKEIKDLEAPYTKEGLVGDEFVTNSKDFVGYKLVESPEKTTIRMTKDEQTLIYYYEPVYTGLLENHIDDKTGKILYTEEHSVQVGESYDIPSKNFEGYDLVTSKLPSNASGVMGEYLVTVNYYYIKKAVLEVHYIDKTTGEKLTNPVIDDTKHEGDSYTTEQKTFENYDLVEVPSNAEGTLTVETDEYGNITNNKTVVTYYYVKKSAGVEEHHIDIQTGEELEPPTMHEGHVGDPYDIKSKDFLSYQVATTDKDGNSVLPTNAQGTMTEDKLVVTYYYYQPAKVIVHYVDKTTGKEIEEINPETGELQSSQVVIDGTKDDPYKTTAKEFDYYKLVEIPEEPNGTMKVEITKDENGNDVVNNTIDVYYYYEPKPFNIGVEKEITGIIVNGNRRSATNGKLEKVDIYRKSTENTSVQVEYKIKVMNTGEVKGRAIIEDKIPEGMSLANNDGTWEVNNGTITKVIPEIGAGETKEYTVLLNWNTSGNNMGNKINEVSLIQTDNVPGFKDNNDKDNTDQATVSISVETGELPVGLLIALVGLVALESVTLRYAVVLTKRQKKSNTKVQKKTNKK